MSQKPYLMRKHNCFMICKSFRKNKHEGPSLTQSVSE